MKNIHRFITALKRYKIYVNSIFPFFSCFFFIFAKLKGEKKKYSLCGWPGGTKKNSFPEYMYDVI